jgi:DNA invertase Pin-like site-specific DNA recombinase
MNKKFIAYYRVSTNKQEHGIDAQKNTVQKWIIGRGEIINSFQENISGKINDRAELLKAVEFCKKENATLLIAKLDRLSRNVSFLFDLKDSGIDIACCDLPELNTLTLGIFATMAQHERELISKRVKDGLEIAKSKGKVGGAKKGVDTQKAVIKSLEVRKIKANIRNKNAIAMAKTLRNLGMSIENIRNKMIEAGFKSSRGLQVSIKGVQRWLNA